jgi:hypothetical protein
MTTTYTVPFASDVDRVRFHIADTNVSGAIFSNEEISAAISEAGDWRNAVILLLNGMITRIATNPNMTAAWLNVDGGVALAHYTHLLISKRREFGLAGIAADAVQQVRADADGSDNVSEYSG